MFLRGAFFGCVDAYDMEGVRHMNTIQTQSIVNGIELVFSDDNTEVYVTIKNPTMSFSKEKVLKYLKDIGVTTGIDYAEIDKMLAEKHATKRYKVAQSKKPVDGKDGWFEFLFDTDVSTKPKILKDGSVDYSEYGNVPFVDEGEKIAIYHPAVQGEDGLSFSNEVIVAKKGKDLARLKGKGFYAEGNEYFAKTQGRVTYKDERLLVENELLIDGDVSLATGDINFSGNIHIRGNVLTGVVVASAKGDVIVDGYVEACQIYAGGSVVMKNGMQGNGKGKIIAGGSVSGKFFERVTIESGMDVHANAIMNSDITAVQDIVVSGKFGIIIGGCIRTQRQVTATIIGNMSEVKTILQVGSDVDLYATLLANEKDQKDLKKEYDKINAVMKKVDEALQAGENRQLEMQKRKLLRGKIEKETQLTENLKKNKKIMDQIARCSQAKIKVQKALYPGTSIMMNGVKAVISDEAYDAVITVKGNVIEIS